MGLHHHRNSSETPVPAIPGISRQRSPSRRQDSSSQNLSLSRSVPPSRIEKQWTAIVIHHSATETGNVAIFDRMHREENHWDGVGYDFVIGNGTDSGDGQVEVTFRWRQQVPGAHCGGTPDNWANADAVGICLVGNFNNTEPTANQMQSLSKLVGFLLKRYEIRTERIYGHSSTPGAQVTDCPGTYSPVPRLRKMLGS
ncbi:MAG: peptidoglycan recognition protein family protein [Planctomycetota bacterium]